MINTLVEDARSIGIEKIIGYYHPTAKNSMVRDFYKTMNFHKHSADQEGNTVWVLDLREYQPKKIHMAIIRNNRDD